MRMEVKEGPGAEQGDIAATVLSTTEDASIQQGGWLPLYANT